MCLQRYLHNTYKDTIIQRATKKGEEVYPLAQALSNGFTDGEPYANMTSDALRAEEHKVKQGVTIMEVLTALETNTLDKEPMSCATIHSMCFN